MTKRIEWADAIKGTLILLVVLGHCIQSVHQQRGGDFMDSYLWNLIYSFHMPAFIAMSGFLAFRTDNKSRKLSECRGAKPLGLVIYRRMRQLVIPFIIWSIIMFFVNHNVDYITDYILYPNKSYWFLWALFFIVAIFNTIDYLSTKFFLNQELAFVTTAIILIGLNFLLPDSKLLGFEYISYYFAFYILAYFLHKYNRFIPKNSWILAVLAALWFVLGSFYKAKGVPVIVNWIPYLHDSLLNIAYRVITATIFIFMMLGFGYKINVGHNSAWKYILEFGNISLGVYAVHMVLRGWLVKGLDYIMPWCPDWVLIIFSFILLSLLSLWFVRFFSRSKATTTWLLGKI